MAQKKQKYVDQKANEYLEQCCKKRAEFYEKLVIFHDEVQHVNPEVADAVREMEELIIDCISDIRDAFSSGYAAAENA